MTSANFCQRRSGRANMMLLAVLELPDRLQQVTLRNLSSDGALVEGAATLSENCELIFRRKELEVVGRVVWVRGSFAGIAFNRPLDRSAVLRHVTARRTRPEPQPICRRPAVTRHEISPEEQRWLGEWMRSAPADRPGES